MECATVIPWLRLKITAGIMIAALSFGWAPLSLSALPLPSAGRALWLTPVPFPPKSCPTPGSPWFPATLMDPESKPLSANVLTCLAGVDKMVRNKTVTVKLNLTGTDFTRFLGRPPGESFMTHSSTVLALLALLFDAGAARVRLVESTQSQADLKSTLDTAGWDVNAISALGKVEYENTRNLGQGKSYSTLRVPFGGYMFSAFDLNHSYHDTDVMISLAKLKRHITAGVTLSMKNLFGLTPNSLYGAEAGSEKATEGRFPLHDPAGYEKLKMPGLKTDAALQRPFFPRASHRRGCLRRAAHRPGHH